MNKFPLSERLRPKKFEDFIGMNKTFERKSWLFQSIENNYPLSILLYGPPGSGKTTFARLYGGALSKNFVCLSGVDATIAEVKKNIAKVKDQPLFYEKLILFVDEIHRLNKAQQDTFLPYLEDGTFILIAATTENPSFALNNALLSRLRTVELGPLNEDGMALLFAQYMKLPGKVELTDEALKYLIAISSGDARFFLNCIEDIEQLNITKLTLSDIKDNISKKVPSYDRDGNYHHSLISALHKAIRGSDPDAALYWLCRMLDSGEDPNYLIRRLIRVATEDIGLSDPNALEIAINVSKVYQILGFPEGELAIAELVIYLSLAPKSNAVYEAFKKAKKIAKESANLLPPSIIINAPNQWMKNEGYGKGYIYDHETKFCFSGQNYFPEKMKPINFYDPKEVGFEREMSKRLKYFQNLRKKLTSL
jgi:putative ATPase